MGTKVYIGPHLSQYTNGQRIAEVNGGTVGECLKHLVKQFPGIEEVLFNEHGELLGYVGIYVNGESAYPEELIKPVKEGDELSIALMVGGG